MTGLSYSWSGKKRPGWVRLAGLREGEGRVVRDPHVRSAFRSRAGATQPPTLRQAQEGWSVAMNTKLPQPITPLRQRTPAVRGLEQTPSAARRRAQGVPTATTASRKQKVTFPDFRHHAPGLRETHVTAWHAPDGITKRRAAGSAAMSHALAAVPIRRH